jgi:protein-S-isoprenylcysteine O-methyltransferase Ste14
MYGWITFGIGTILILWLSWQSLRQPRSHGFHRFFVFEAILGLFLLNLRGWFADPLNWHQILSWILLISSIPPVVYGVLLLRSAGKPKGSFEATTQLVTNGIYHFIRHPLYTSLLYLAWGIFFKSPSLLDGCITVVATAFIYATARADENECLVKFGGQYADYMKTTKMFIPFLF